MRIAVLGAGIVGVSCAEWLRRDGHSVTLIDRVEPGDPRQTSYGNAGILANAGVVPVPVPGVLAKAPAMLLDPDGPLFLRWSYLPRLMPWLGRYLRAGREREVRRISAALAPLVADTASQHRALAAGTPAERFLHEGRYTLLFRTRAEAEADRLGQALREAAGIAATALDRAALEDRDPALGPRYGHGLAFRDSAHVSDPGAYTAALHGHFRREGGAFLAGEIDGLTADGDGATVTVDGQSHGFERAVLALGAFSGRFLRALGHDPGLEAERGYHLMLEGPSHRPPAPYLLSDAKFAVTPMEGGLRLAGLVEFGGLDRRLSGGPVGMLRRWARRVYPDLAWEREHVWLGHRPATIDSLPVLGPLPGRPSVLCAFGAQHLGLTQGPKTGRLVADMVAGRRPNIDLAPYAPGRFD